MTRTGKAWTQREVRDTLTRLGRRRGLRLHPHLLRHSAASISLARGANIEAVRDMLGHASLSTTQRYVRAAATLDGSPAYSLATAVAPRMTSKSAALLLALCRLLSHCLRGTFVCEVFQSLFARSFPEIMARCKHSCNR